MQRTSFAGDFMVKKRRISPFGFFDDEFERMMERMMEDMSRGFSGIDMNELEKRARGGKSFVRGYSVTVGPDGKPVVREFGDKPAVTTKGTEEKREPLVDVIEEKTKLKIIAELPGVSKDDIQLNATKENLEIKVNAPERKYYKSLELPAMIKPETANASYKNGVLEITLDRVEPAKEEKSSGHKIKIE